MYIQHVYIYIYIYTLEAKDIKKRWQEYTEELYKKIFMTQIPMMV